MANTETIPCPACGVQNFADEARCRKCGSGLDARDAARKPSVRVPVPERPVAGIVVGGLLGATSLLWCLYQMSTSLTQNPGGIQAQMFILFPGLQGLGFLGNAIGNSGWTVLLIGVGMAYLNHPNGATVVRATSWIMMAVTTLQSILMLSLMSEAESWSQLPPPIRGGFIGGVVGGFIAGIAEFGLILFLFRRRGHTPE